MEKLAAVDGLIVRQQKEWGEILTGFETRNRYVVTDTRGHDLYFAAEQGGNLLLRWFLKALRPFEINLLDNNGHVVFHVKRPFRFYFHEATVVDDKGRELGKIRRNFSILRRIYLVLDTTGNERFRLFGPILHPWTFEIKKEESTVGKITKKWSGLLKEGFTDADNFGVSFPRDWDAKRKALFLGAVFLIDFVHFENKGND